VAQNSTAIELLSTTGSMCPHYRIKVEPRHPAVTS